MATIQSYTDSEGLAHWPSAPLNSEKYYGISWDAYLTNENDTIGLATWVVPTGLTSMDEDVVSNQTRIKLSADSVGEYEISCSLTSTEGSDSQVHVQIMNINVV